MKGSTTRSRGNWKIFWNKWKWGHNNPKSVGHWEGNHKKEIHKLQAYLKKTTKAQINNLTSHLKELEKEQQTKPKVLRRKKIIKIRERINEIESKKWYKR